MIRHQVFLHFKQDVSEQTKKLLYSDLAGLSGHIDGILDFQIRSNISLETDLVHGFSEMFWFDFKDIATRDAYLIDEAHQAVGARIFAEIEGGPDGIFVCDVEV